jgi:hypothetical protein
MRCGSARTTAIRSSKWSRWTNAPFLVLPRGRVLKWHPPFSLARHDSNFIHGGSRAAALVVAPFAAADAGRSGDAASRSKVASDSPPLWWDTDAAGRGRRFARDGVGRCKTRTGGGNRYFGMWPAATRRGLFTFGRRAAGLCGAVRGRFARRAAAIPARTFVGN